MFKIYFIAICIFLIKTSIFENSKKDIIVPIKSEKAKYLPKINISNNIPQEKYTKLQEKIVDLNQKLIFAKHLLKIAESSIKETKEVNKTEEIGDIYFDVDACYEKCEEGSKSMWDKTRCLKVGYINSEKLYRCEDEQDIAKKDICEEEVREEGGLYVQKYKEDIWVSSGDKERYEEIQKKERDNLADSIADRIKRDKE